MNKTRIAKFQIGQVVRHRLFPFRGVIFDIDPEFNNTDEWYSRSGRPPSAQGSRHHLFAENARPKVAYVSGQNLLADTSELVRLQVAGVREGR